MSTIRKTPYIETALSLLADTDKSDLLAIVNSATPVTTQASFNSLVEGINAVIFTFKDGTIKTGILINTTELQLLIGYHTSEQALELIKLNTTNDTWEIVDEYCDINELRRVLGSSAGGGGGIELVDALPEATEEEYNKHKLYLNDGDLYYINNGISNNFLWEGSYYYGSAENENDVYQYITIDNNIYFYQSNTIYKFDVESKTQTSLVSASTGNSNSTCGTADLDGDYIYFRSGYQWIYKYNYKNNTIQQFISSTTNINLYCGSTIYNGYLYTFGGANGNSQNVGQIIKYKLDDGTTTLLSTITDGIRTQTYRCGNLVYIVVLGTSSDFWDANKIYKFDLESETLTTTNLKFDVRDFGIAYFNSKVYLVGGRKKGTTYKGVVIFNASSETFTEIATELGSTRYRAGIGTYENCIYLLYGNASGSTRYINKMTFPEIINYKKITSTDVN